MEFPGINYLAVLVAAVAYWILGAIWYSPILFGNAWLKFLGKSKEQAIADHTPLNYVWALATAFIASYGVARFCQWTMVSTIWDGIVTGLMIGVCFVLAAFFMNDAFENKPKGLTLINGLYHVVSLIVVGIIIAAWR